MKKLFAGSSAAPRLSRAAIASTIGIFCGLLSPSLSPSVLGATNAGVFKSAAPLSKSSAAKPLSAASACPVNGITSSSTAINLTSDCQVAGNITLSGTGSLTVTGAVLTVKGNVVMSDTAQMTVSNGSLVFPQTNYSQYAMTLNNSAQLTLTNSTFVTNGTGQNNFSMGLEARNNSIVDFETSTLSLVNSWLLGTFHDTSKLIVNHSSNLPTEIYPSSRAADAPAISMSNSDAPTLWVDFAAGNSGTINVPRFDADGNFNFDFGKSAGFKPSIHVAASRFRLGLNSHPGSSLIVNGGGAAGDGDVDSVFGYYVENSSAPVSINGLNVGNDVTRQFTDQGRNLSLNHVHLSPLSWQVYVSQSNGFPVTISSSKVNEVAALTNGMVNVQNSVLQLAIVGAVGPGSQVNITGTQIWSQAILAQNGGHLNVSFSLLHGNFISAQGAGSSVSLFNVGEYKNGAASMSCATAPDTGAPPNTNGVPLCNPINPLGLCSKVVVQDGGVVTGAPPCI